MSCLAADAPIRFTGPAAIDILPPAGIRVLSDEFVTLPSVVRRFMVLAGQPQLQCSSECLRKLQIVGNPK